MLLISVKINWLPSTTANLSYLRDRQFSYRNVGESRVQCKAKLWSKFPCSRHKWLKDSGSRASHILNLSN